MQFRTLTIITTCIVTLLSHAQDIDLFQQFNGRYDYTALGNTLNIIENGPNVTCDILTSSSASLNLDPSQDIVAAYLYWAGSGTGDFDIEVNGIPITAERTFSDALDDVRVFFAAFADITTIVQTEGSTNYTISEFDLTNVIAPFCPTGTNFGGWAITVIYQDESLPLNQLNVYDGLQSVPTELTITLENLNVLDNVGAKIGFVAWEGDASLAVNEQLTINGNVIGNIPLNPLNNAFNGTNTFTGASDLYNMDIDVYNIQNNISVGDTSATIELTSGQDFVMINNIITVLNSQLPDATITLDGFDVRCNDRRVTIDYTVFNTNSTDPLPANTPIAFYADGILVGQSATQSIIDINDAESGTLDLIIPESVNDAFQLIIIVDDDGTGQGTVTELNEINNSTTSVINLLSSPPIETLPASLLCDISFNSAQFNLFQILQDNGIDTSINVEFYRSLEELEAITNEINNPSNFNNETSPQIIYARVETSPCYSVYEFDLEVENCPPIIPEGFSPNDDNINDWFNIQGLYNIFEHHKLKIFNRYGTLIFEGDNNKPWRGYTNRGINNRGKLVPVGTYFYIIEFNDSNYEPEAGWVYVNY